MLTKAMIEQGDYRVTFHGVGNRLHLDANSVKAAESVAIEVKPGDIDFYVDSYENEEGDLIPCEDGQGCGFVRMTAHLAERAGARLGWRAESILIFTRQIEFYVRPI